MFELLSVEVGVLLHLFPSQFAPLLRSNKPAYHQILSVLSPALSPVLSLVSAVPLVIPSKPTHGLCLHQPAYSIHSMDPGSPVLEDLGFLDLFGSQDKNHSMDLDAGLSSVGLPELDEGQLSLQMDSGLRRFPGACVLVLWPTQVPSTHSLGLHCFCAVCIHLATACLRAMMLRRLIVR